MREEHRESMRAKEARASYFVDRSDGGFGVLGLEQVMGMVAQLKSGESLEVSRGQARTARQLLKRVVAEKRPAGQDGWLVPGSLIEEIASWLKGE